MSRDPEALYEAVAKGYADKVGRLLRGGCPTTHVDWRGRSLAMVAGERGDAKVLDLLAKSGCDLGAKDAGATTVLMRAAGASKDGAAVKFLLAAGCDADAKNSAGQTALMSAAGAGRLAAVVLLLESGADFQARDGAGRSALDWARGRGFGDCERCLESFSLRLDLDGLAGRGPHRESLRI